MLPVKPVGQLRHQEAFSCIRGGWTLLMEAFAPLVTESAMRGLERGSFDTLRSLRWRGLLRFSEFVEVIVIIFVIIIGTVS